MNNVQWINCSSKSDDIDFKCFKQKMKIIWGGGRTARNESLSGEEKDEEL